MHKSFEQLSGYTRLCLARNIYEGKTVQEFSGDLAELDVRHVSGSFSEVCNTA